MSQTEKLEKSLDEKLDEVIDQFFLETEETKEEQPETEVVEKSEASDTDAGDSAAATDSDDAVTSTEETDTGVEEGDTETAATTEVATDDDMEKSMKEPPMKSGANKTKVDEGEQPKKAKKDKERGEGRPNEVQDVPDVDEDGNRAKGYDSVQAPQSKTPDISAKNTYVKSFEISEADYELLQKAKKAQEEESLQKAKQEQTDLIKSAVSEAVGDVKKENEELKKALDETLSLVKSISKKPKDRKSISSIQAIEKSFGDNETATGSKYYSPEELLNKAEELQKAGELTEEHVIELEMTGRIFDTQARQKLEKSLKN